MDFKKSNAMKYYYELTKSGLVFGNLITVIAGFLLGARVIQGMDGRILSVNFLLLVATVVGIAFVMVVLLAIYVMGSAKRAARRRSPGAGNLWWALLFLTSGRVPPPPPEAQIEAELNGEKDRAASDTLRRPGNTH